MDEIGAEVTGTSVGGEIGEIGASVIGAVGGIRTTTGATGGSTETTGTSLFPFSAPVIIIGIVIGSSMLPGRLTGTRVGSGIISFGGLVGNETGGFVGSGMISTGASTITGAAAGTGTVGLVLGCFLTGVAVGPIIAEGKDVNGTFDGAGVIVTFDGAGVIVTFDGAGVIVTFDGAGVIVTFDGAGVIDTFDGAGEIVAFVGCSRRCTVCVYTSFNSASSYEQPQTSRHKLESRMLRQ